MARHPKKRPNPGVRSKPETKKGREQAAKKLTGIAARFAQFKPAREVLKVVRAVPTCFLDFDFASRVGGVPLEYVTLIHGPSNQGKSLAVLGIVKSFLESNHFVLYGDAERTTPQTWVRQLMGDLLDHERFYATRPESYQDFIGEVRNFFHSVRDAIRAGEVPPDTACVVVVDSLGKLSPQDVLKEILAEFKKEDEEAAKSRFKKAPVTTGKNMMGMRKAAINSAWIDELTPQMECCNGSVVLVEREYVKKDATEAERDRGEDFVVRGGAAPFFESGIAMRATREKWVEHGTGADRVVYGEKHLLTVRKTKVGGKDGRVTLCRFHSSNGNLTAFGFDPARDLLDDLAIRVGSVKRAGNSYKFGGAVIGVGLDSAVKKLAANPELLAKVQAATRARFGDHAPVEVEPTEAQLKKHNVHTGEVVDEDDDTLFASTGST